MKMKIQTNRLKIGLRGLIIGLTMLVEASLHFGTYLGGNNQTASLNQTTTTVDTSLDQNECLCDTIYNACDPYCCCDTFCGADLLQIYRTSQTCQVNEIIDPLDQFKCEGFSEYFKRLSDKKYQVEVNSYRSVFCVRYDNRPNVKDLFVDQDSLSSTVAGALIEGESSLVASYYQPITQTTGVSSGTEYGLNNVMRVSQGGILRASTSSVCQTTSDIYYLQNEETGCIFEEKILASCQIPPLLNPTLIVDSLKLFQGREGTQIIEILPANIVYFEQDQTTFQYQIVTAVPNPLVVTQGTECQYQALVKGIEYIIEVSNSRVVAIKAIVELTKKTVTQDQILRFFRPTKIKFVSSAQAIANLGEQFSGSPGYKIGSPVIIADATTTLRRYFNDWFPFPGIDSEGTCTTSNQAFNHPIGFGVNQTLSCLIPEPIFDTRVVNAAQCSRFIQIYKALLLKNSFKATTRFGIYGNANPQKAADWRPVDDFLLDADVTQNFTDGYCFAPTGLQTTFYYSYVVSEDVKQFYIQRIVQQPVFLNFTRRQQLIFRFNIRFVEKVPDSVQSRTTSWYYFLNSIVARDIAPILLASTPVSRRFSSILRDWVASIALLLAALLFVGD